MKFLHSFWGNNNDMKSSIELNPFINPIVGSNLPQVSSIDNIDDTAEPVTLRIIVAGDPATGRCALCRALCSPDDKGSSNESTYIGSTTEEGSPIVPTVHVGQAIVTTTEGSTRKVFIEFWIISCTSDVSLDLIKASLAEAPPDGIILIFDTDRPTTQHSLTGWLFDFISPNSNSPTVTSPSRSRSLSTLGGIDTARDVTNGVCPLMVVANNREGKWQWPSGEARLPRPPTWVDKFLVGEMSPRWASSIASTAAENGMEAVRNKLLRFDSSSSETLFSIASLSDTTTQVDRRAWTELLQRSLRYHNHKLFGGV